MWSPWPSRPRQPRPARRWPPERGQPAHPVRGRPPARARQAGRHRRPPDLQASDRHAMNALLWHARAWPRPAAAVAADPARQAHLRHRRRREDRRRSCGAAAVRGPEREGLSGRGVRTGEHRSRGDRLAARPRCHGPSESGGVGVRTRRGGVASLTRFERLARVPAARVGLSLLRCRLVTGRTHQIRVHLAARGWPIVGDPTYGEPRWSQVADPALAAALRAFPRQALHAWRVALTHPVTGERLQIDAPVPLDLAELLSASGLAPLFRTALARRYRRSRPVSSCSGGPTLLLILEPTCRRC